MKKLVVSLLLLLINNAFIAQTNFKTYSWEEAKGLNPDSIFSISFEKERIDSLPTELMKFVHLKNLNLGKNKLHHLPDSFDVFSQLEILNMEKNNLEEFPLVICRLPALKELIMNRNNFAVIPFSIGKLSQLEFLDIWATPVATFPDVLLTMKNLKHIDARGVLHGPKFQKSWAEKLSWIKIDFDAPCNCFE